MFTVGQVNKRTYVRARSTQNTQNLLLSQKLRVEYVDQKYLRADLPGICQADYRGWLLESKSCQAWRGMIFQNSARERPSLSEMFIMGLDCPNGPTVSIMDPKCLVSIMDLDCPNGPNVAIIDPKCLVSTMGKQQDTIETDIL